MTGAGSDATSGQRPAVRLRDMAQEWTEAPSYKPRYNHAAVTDAHYSVQEMVDKAETSQRLLDVVNIKDGYPQSGGDLDSRVAEAVLELVHAQGFLGSIANAHQQTQMGGGVVSGYCMECERVWPCPTFQWANGDRDLNDSWEGSDDG